MAILKVKELLGSRLLVNLDHVKWITSDNNHAVLWFGPADVDSIRLEESFEDVENMLLIAKGVFTSESSYLHGERR